MGRATGKAGNRALRLVTELVSWMSGLLPVQLKTGIISLNLEPTSYCHPTNVEIVIWKPFMCDFFWNFTWLGGILLWYYSYHQGNLSMTWSSFFITSMYVLVFLLISTLLVVYHTAEVEMMKEKFAKLLLGEDMSGGGKGVCTALAISNSITNLSASVFGELWRLEPLAVERRTMWRREMEWLLSVSDHIVELVPSWQSYPDGSPLEVSSFCSFACKYICDFSSR